ncbi:MAG TPA: carbamoyltransferase C-terminal domain-containing protein [candidate division Zixibacteria bacterium]|nr:carbamoyltransferase C-terminal domain-containing protein [candidate division Zixibacteria bacterium]
MNEVVMKVIGLNFGHDAGVALASSSEIRLAEMERILGRKHVCGGDTRVEKASRELINAWLEEYGNPDALALIDYHTPGAYIPESIRRIIYSEEWEYKGNLNDEHLFIRSVEIPDDFLGLPLHFKNIYIVRHHWAHAALAYYTSQFDEALVVCLDGTGCFADCGLVCVGENNQLRAKELFSNINGPRFGLLYESYTRRVFGSQFDAGKLMALSAFGVVREDLRNIFRVILANNKYRHLARVYLDPVDDKELIGSRVRYGSHWYTYDDKTGGFLDSHCRTYGDFLNFAYQFPDEIEINGKSIVLSFDYHTSLCRDIAATIQDVFESELIRLLTGLHYALPKYQNLCFTGGCALNILANTRILESGLFQNVYIPSCCNDSGVALGAGLALSKPSCDCLWRSGYFSSMRLALAGLPLYGLEELDNMVTLKQNEGFDISLEYFEHDSDVLSKVANQLSGGLVIGWIQGHCETGPRALGNRSILASPLHEGIKNKVSEEIKGRESFRPIAPVCPIEDVTKYFRCIVNSSPLMLFSFQVKQEYQKVLSQVTHVDGTARVQTVCREEHKDLYGLLRYFESITGIPILMNTSLNGPGKPIINSLHDALYLLTNTSIDGIVFKDINAICLKPINKVPYKKSTALVEVVR